MYFQYLLVFLTGLLTYRIFEIIANKPQTAFWAGLISTLNLSTIFYAYNILSESVSIFLFTAVVYTILIYFTGKRYLYLLLCGFLAGCLVLARFNMIGIPLVVLICILSRYIINNHFIKLKRLALEILTVMIPIGVVINSWCLYNLATRGYYNLFPPQHYGQRWAIPATIDESNVVSQQYSEVLKIFLEERKKLGPFKNDVNLRKASLLKNKYIKRISDFFTLKNNGFALYSSAVPKLLAYYKLSYSPNNIEIMGKKLLPFYQEIAEQNKKELFKLRVFSFLYSFKSNSPIIRTETKVNLNSLPDAIIIFYKIFFMIACVFVYAFSLFHLSWIMIRKKWKTHFLYMILYFFIWYLPLINTYANVLGDAYRFKYPAESIILGLFVLIVTRLFSKYRSYFNNRTENKVLTV